MRSSYDSSEVMILLKDITGMVKPQSTIEREKLIQSGRHYCEMLPIEYSPSQSYLDAYEEALDHYSEATAKAVGKVADLIVKQKGKQVVLVSLARAGIPIGILIKRYIQRKYQIDVPHYAISIIRGRGIDHNAMKYILQRHQPEQLQFVDGWIGKGAILKELRADLSEYPGVSSELAVVADPANLTNLCGTHEDILIPSSCLNSTVSGLISRTFLREDIIGENDFHGAVYYGELKEHDLSREFLDCIESKFVFEEETNVSAAGTTKINQPVRTTGMQEVQRIIDTYQISDINFVKPGIGEATRVLLRRVPWKILIKEDEMENPMLEHLLRLAKEKEVPVEAYPLENYIACGIIKKCADV